jgi:hypothetical protein
MKPVGWWNEKRRINWLDAVLETKEDGWNTPLYTAPRKLSDEEIDTCAYETGMWCDGTPDAWDTEAIHNFARAILKKASEK